MFNCKQKPTREVPQKREDALARSCYSIIKQKKETKAALEKSKMGLVAKR